MSLSDIPATVENVYKSSAQSIGERKNEGKLRWRNVPLFLLKPLMEVGHAGEKKYTTFNFLKGMKANDSLDCLKRHLEKLESPFESDIDSDTGCHHAAMIAWNALVLCFMLINRPDLDDRIKVQDVPTIEQPKESEESNANASK